MPFEILELQRNVAEGAELLDNALDLDDWAAQIDVETLDMSEPEHCVLGQLFAGAEYQRSGYTTGVNSLGLDIWADEDETHGFNLSPTNPGVAGGMPARWEILRQLWLFQITIRTS